MGFDKTYLPCSSRCRLEDMQGSFVKPPSKPLYGKVDKCLEAYSMVFRRVAKLDLVGKVMDQASLAETMRIAREVTGCLEGPARTFLQPFHRCLMTQRAINILCWQVAGNRDRLKDAEVLMYGGRPEELGWFNCTIAEALHDGHSPNGCYRLRVMDGPAAGLDLYTPVPKSLRRLSDVIGATRRVDKERLRMTDPREAVQMQVLAYPEPGRLVEFSPHYGHVSLAATAARDLVAVLRATQKQKDANGELAASRRTKCHKGLSNPCHMCQVGYDQCPIGTKPTTTCSIGGTVDLKIKGKNICPQTTSDEA